MSQHPIQLPLRFVLELGGLAAFAYWGWAQGTGVLRLVYALGLISLIAAIWAGTAIQDDPTRSGRTLLSVPGAVRLLIELGFFGAAVWMLLDMGRAGLAIAQGVIVRAHYVLSYDRIAWLLRR
jgi:hypothetical protein